MSKYLELFKGSFDDSINEKTKPENKPYIGYSLTDGIAYTVVPKPVVGPADNEIWCTVNSELIPVPGALYSFNYSYDESTGKYIISTISGDKFTALIPFDLANLDERPDLITLYLPKSLEIIKWSLLSNSNNLSEIYFNGDKGSWSKVKKVDIDSTINIKATVVHCIDGDISVSDRTNEYFPPAPEEGN